MKAKKAYGIGFLVLVFLFWSSVGLAVGLAKVRASHQPCMHALPTILCQKLGWFKELGIDVSFHYYSSGMPQVEAGLAGEWDLGALWVRLLHFLQA